jgi:hypothetical protein
MRDVRSMFKTRTTEELLGDLIECARRSEPETPIIIDMILDELTNRFNK